MNNAIEQLTLQKNSLYRDNYRRVMTYLLVLIITGLALLGVLGYQVISTPQPLYFATTTTGRIVPLQSLSMPVVTNNYLLQWASLAVRAVYNLTFLNYQTQLNQASGYFTPQGWGALMNAMKKEGVLDTLKSKKLFMAAVVEGAPVILDAEILHGRYAWRVQLPLLVTYTNASGDAYQSHFIVTMDILRVPVLDAVKGIQINNFIIQSR